MKISDVAFFQNLCDSCMSVHALLLLSSMHTLGLGLDLGNSLDRRERNSARMLIHKSQSFRKKKVTAPTKRHSILLVSELCNNFGNNGKIQLTMVTTKTLRVKKRGQSKNVLVVVVYIHLPVTVSLDSVRR